MKCLSTFLLLVSVLCSQAQTTFNGVTTSGTFERFSTNAFNPNTMGGLKAWYMGSYILGQDTSLGTNSVSSWTDRSGNGNHCIQGTSGNRPWILNNFLNGVPVVYFDGLQRRLTCDAISAFATGLNTPGTIIMVANSFMVDANSPVVCFGNSTNNSPNIMIKAPSGGTAFRYSRIDDVPTTVNTQLNGFSTNGWHIAGASFDGANALMLVDSTITNLATSVTQITLSNFTLGMKHGTTFNNPWTGKMAEFMYFNRALSTNEVNTVRDYLNLKYKIY